MVTRKIFFLYFLLLYPFECSGTILWAEQIKQTGYVELKGTNHDSATFETLYACFDEFIAFLQTHPEWAQKLYHAKERFIRSKKRHYYGTDFFGFYDESTREGRSQIAFYYATDFHTFICTDYPAFNTVPEIICFFECCHEIQKPYHHLSREIAAALGLETIFPYKLDLPLLLKVVKYLPAYRPTRPHYDGTAFSLLLHSTNNESLLLCPYNASLTVDDFYCPLRHYVRSILLIPGTQVTEFCLYPTPHFVTHSGTIRYATIAFAMRPDYTVRKNELFPLPNCNH